MEQTRAAGDRVAAYAAALDTYLRSPGEVDAAAVCRREAAAHGGIAGLLDVHHAALSRIAARPDLAAAMARVARFLATGLQAATGTRGDDAEDAETATRELERFCYAISHDLRAPLRAIEGFAQALFEDCAERLDPAGRDYLGHVRRSAARLSLMLDDLLALSRLSGDQLRRVPVDVSAMAAGVLSELGAAEPSRTVAAVVQPGMRADADPRLLRTALGHLIGNAWKFTRPRADAHIECGTLPHAAPTVFIVRDNGVGFDMAYAARLFVPFQRLHPVEQFEGRGIGLAMVQRIVRRHGGRVWTDAAANAGACFFFTLDGGR